MKKNREQLERRISVLVKRIDNSAPVKELKKLENKLTRMNEVGFRAVCYGDDYNYGGYSNHLFEDYGRRRAEKRAQAQVARADNRGHVEIIMRGKEEVKGRIS